MKIKSKTMLGVSLFAMTFSFSATAQTCKPVPSCESLGYTATSCSGDSIKCPFDESKLHCVETCKNECRVGDIYYSDDTCSDDVIDSKTPIGVVFDIDRKLVLQIDQESLPWNDGTENYKDIPELTNYKKTNVRDDVNGKNNTDIIVAFAQSSGQAHKAAQYCHDMTTGGKTWYLPALGEMAAMEKNHDKVAATLSIVWGGRFYGGIASTAGDYRYVPQWKNSDVLFNQWAFKDSLQIARCIFSYK